MTDRDKLVRDEVERRDESERCAFPKDPHQDAIDAMAEDVARIATAPQTPRGMSVSEARKVVRNWIMSADDHTYFDRDIDTLIAAVRAATIQEVRERLSQNESAVERDGGEQAMRDVSDGLELAHRVLDALQEKAK